MDEQGVYIHELATAGTLSANDYFIVDTGSAEVKVPFSDLQDQIMVGNYTNVTDWDSFKPGSTREIRHGYSTGGTATGVPVEGDNITYYGWVEGVTTYCTQHLYTQYTGTSGNKNRYWLRQCLNGTWGNWVEVTKNWWSNAEVTDLDAVTETGIYTFSSSATNRPEAQGSAGGTMLVLKTSSTYIHQVIYSNKSNGIPSVFHRLKTANGWGEWFFLNTTGYSVQSSELIYKNIDNLPTLNVYGVWYVNLDSSAGIEGTKPRTSGQGILMCLRQTSNLVRQVYIPVASLESKMLYRVYNFSTANWGEWSEATFAGGVMTYTRTLSVGTGTKTSEIDISALSDRRVINAALTNDSVGSSSLCRVNSIVIDKLRNKLRVETYNGESGSVTLTFTIYYV